MGKTVSTALLTGVLVALPLIGNVAASPAPVAKRASAAVASHATKGTIKVMDEKHLVITRSKAKPTEMTFVVDPTTQKEGPMAVGSIVEVRYRADGKTLIATAITDQSKQQASAHTAPKAK